MLGGAKLMKEVDMVGCVGYRDGRDSSAQRRATVWERNVCSSPRWRPYVPRPEWGGGQGPPDKGCWIPTL